MKVYQTFMLWNGLSLCSCSPRIKVLINMMIKIKFIAFNSIKPCGAYVRQLSESTLVQVMACGKVITEHVLIYLNLNTII